MTILILSISLLVALCSALWQIRTEYRAEMEALQRDLALIETTHLPALTAAVWALDPQLIDKQLAGIARLPNISFVTVRGRFPFDPGRWGESIAALEQPPEWPVIQRRYELRQERGGQLLGTLEVEASLQALHQRLHLLALRIALTELVRSLVLVAAIAFGLRWLLLRHLLQVTAFMARLNLARLDEALQLQRRGVRNDELDTLVASINAMRISLREEIARREASERTSQQLAVEKEALELAGEAKRQFFAQISHEIRTPMNAILGMSHLLLQQECDETARQHANRIRRAAQSLLAIIDDILDLSKLDAGRLELDQVPFALDELIDGLLDMVRQQAEEKGLALQVAIADDVPAQLCGDPLRLRQILLNLLANAVKFTSRGFVRLTIDVLARDGRRVTLRFAVQDSGIGLSPAQIERIFTPYSQADRSISRRFGGTGLGLALSQRLAALMGAQIGVDSREGEGSIFFFELTLEVATVAAGGAEGGAVGLSEAEIRYRLAGTRWLLVEDNRVNQELAVALMAQVGAHVVVAGSGEEGLELLERDTFDGVLMDEMLPGIGGAETTRRLRQRLHLKQLPVIGMSASIDPAEQVNGIAAGINDFIAKPVNPPAMYATLARWVRTPRRAGGEGST